MSEKFRSFKDMQQSLRAGAAAGMDTVITLEPESATHLAEILEAHERRLSRNVAIQVQGITFDGNAVSDLINRIDDAIDDGAK